MELFGANIESFETLIMVINLSQCGIKAESKACLQQMRSYFGKANNKH